MTKSNHSYRFLYMFVVSLCFIVPICAGLTIWYAFSGSTAPVDSMSAAIPSIDVELYETVSRTFLDRVPSDNRLGQTATSSADGRYTYGRNDPFR